MQQKRRQLVLGALSGGCLLWAAADAPMTLAQETLGSLGTAGSMSGTMSGMGGGSMSPGGAMRGMGGGPGMPGMDEGAGGEGGLPQPGGMGGMGGPGATVTTTIVRRQPLSWSRRTGQDYLNELLAPSPRNLRPSPETTRRSPRAQAAYARRIARMTPAQRKRLVMAKYRKPPVGWLAYYLPQDRYKVTSKIWQYVSIEDDSGAYPVRYYYRPSAWTMLNLLKRSPRGVRRYNRVIGFHTWQDAMLAGYRPDPVTRPAPGAQIADIARLSRGPELERYVGFIYSGEVSPASFDASYTYIRRVARVVSSRSDTRPLMGQTVGQVLAAVLGEGQVPRTVGGTPRLAPAGGMMGGPGGMGAMGGPGGMGAMGGPGGMGGGMGRSGGRGGFSPQ